MVASTVLSMEKETMVRLLHEEHTFSDRFINYMLARLTRSSKPTSGRWGAGLRGARHVPG